MWTCVKFETTKIKVDMNTEWNEFVQSLTEEYGKATNLIWISKKRRKYVLDFAYSRVLFINDEKYNFSDILSCRMETAPCLCGDKDNASEPCVLLIGTTDPTNMLVSLTVWSKSVANEIDSLMQRIIQSNRKFQ